MHRPDVRTDLFEKRGVFGHIQEQEQIERLEWVKKRGTYYLGDDQATMLDVGTGVGDIVCAIRERRTLGGYILTGSDYTTCVEHDEQEIEVFRRIDPSIEVIKEEVQTFTKRLYDGERSWKLCTCCELIEHVTPFEAFQLIYNLLTSCDTLLITTPNAEGPRWDNAAGSGHTMLWTESLLRRVFQPDVQAYSFMRGTLGRALPPLRFDIEKIAGDTFLGAIVQRYGI